MTGLEPNLELFRHYAFLTIALHHDESDDVLPAEQWDECVRTAFVGTAATLDTAIADASECATFSPRGDESSEPDVEHRDATGALNRLAAHNFVLTHVWERTELGYLLAYQPGN